MQCTHILYHMNLLVSYRNPQDTDTQALPACGCFLHIHWWVEGVRCSCVCVCVCALMGLIANLSGKQTTGARKGAWGHAVFALSLFFFSLFQPHVGRPSLTLHTPPITCFSGPWCPPIYGAPLGLCTVGQAAVAVCSACSVPEESGQFTRAAQLLTLFPFFLCSFVSSAGWSPGSSCWGGLMGLMDLQAEMDRS